MAVLRAATRTPRPPWHWRNTFGISEARKHLTGARQLCEVTLSFPLFSFPILNIFNNKQMSMFLSKLSRVEGHLTN